MRSFEVSSLAKTTLGGVLATLVVLGSASVAFADSRDRGIVVSKREAQQRAAIEQGRANGSLTRREYHSLLAEQQKIGDLERRAKADGHISRHEFHQITAAQNAAARHISDDASNRKVSYFRRWLYRTR